MGEPSHPREHQFIDLPVLGKFYFKSTGGWRLFIPEQHGSSASPATLPGLTGHHGAQVLMSLTVLHPRTSNSVTQQVRLCEN